MQISQNTVVRITYTLSDDAGEVIDSSDGGDPLAYVHGTGSLIPGLEKKLEGKLGGDALEVRVPPEDAYGPRDEDLIHEVSRSDLPDDAEIEVGTHFQAETDDGLHLLTVVGIDGDKVALDANHPLAGVALNFKVAVVDVRSATAEEIEHGHVHGPDGEEP